MSDLLAAEWIKLWSLRSTVPTLAGSALVVVGINVSGAVSDYGNYPGYSAQIKSMFVPFWAIRDAFSIGACMVLMLAAAAIGAVTVLSEYSTGQIRTTFVAVPARTPVLVAKTVVVGVVMLGYGAIVAGTSFAVTQAILSGRDIGLSLSYPGVWRVIVASALMAPVSALIGIGVGALIRHTATAIASLSFLLLLVPFLLDERSPAAATVLHGLPRAAWERLVQLGDPLSTATPYPATVTGSWLTYAAWPIVALLIAAVAATDRANPASVASAGCTSSRTTTAAQSAGTAARCRPEASATRATAPIAAARSTLALGPASTWAALSRTHRWSSFSFVSMHRATACGFFLSAGFGM